MRRHEEVVQVSVKIETRLDGVAEMAIPSLQIDDLCESLPNQGTSCSVAFVDELL